jgi:hypothetical protein
VVWADSRLNKDGNHEFAIQFDEPCNLWGVDFPPQDWEEEEESQEATPPRTPGQEISSETSNQKAPPIQTDQTVAGAAAASAKSKAPKSAKGEGSPQEIVIGLTHQEPAHDADSEAVDLTPLIPGHATRAVPTTPADRLAAAVRDLIQSKLSTEQGIAAERLVKALEDRMARMQLDVLDRLTGQIQSLVSTQISVMKQSADEIASLNQEVLSVSLQQLAETADQNARAVQGKAESAVERALDGLRSEVAEQLPQTEKKFLEQCRSLAEQSLSGIVDNSLRTMSLRIEEVGKGIEKIEEHTQKILLDTSAQLERQAATKIDETTKHLEAQLREAAQRIHSSFQQYSITELRKRQQAMEAAFREQMQAVSESSLREMQGALARMLQGLAEKMGPGPD